MTSHRKALRRRVVLGLIAVLALCTPGVTAHAAAQAISCQGANVPTGGIPPATMHGTLCIPSGGSANTVMVLVPGATYNHTYWDFPYQPAHYNFRRAMNQAGYATFVVDRLGTGASSRPLSVLVTSTRQANAVHRVIQALRAGQVGGTAFAKVILGGHSLGSGISLLEAATYNDEDAVLITGFSHHPNVLSFPALFATLYPAFLDPAFAGQGYDPGYLTTLPNTRAADFYAPATTDPIVVATDEATKDVISATEAPDAVGTALLPFSVLIQSPVLVAVGGQDQLFCDPLLNNCANSAALLAAEAPYYSPAAQLQTYVLPGSGHDVNLATVTTSYQNVVRNWADTFVGP